MALGGVRRWLGGFALVCLLALGVGRAQTATVLGRDEAEKILPAAVFYGGQTATLQGRNSAGIRTAEGKLVLASLVDTSGYSSGVAERYQGYLIAEVPLRVEGVELPAGAYGFGFVAGDRVVVMDLGQHELVNAGTHRDGTIRRPAPLLVVADGAGGYRLYLGRSFATLSVGKLP